MIWIIIYLILPTKYLNQDVKYIYGEHLIKKIYLKRLYIIIYTTNIFINIKLVDFGNLITRFTDMVKQWRLQNKLNTKIKLRWI